MTVEVPGCFCCWQRYWQVWQNMEQWSSHHQHPLLPSHAHFWHQQLARWCINWDPSFINRLVICITSITIRLSTGMDSLWMTFDRPISKEEGLTYKHKDLYLKVPRGIFVKVKHFWLYFISIKCDTRWRKILNYTMSPEFCSEDWSQGQREISHVPS